VTTNLRGEYKPLKIRVAVREEEARCEMLADMIHRKQAERLLKRKEKKNKMLKS
jgi:hypothetical protein